MTTEQPEALRLADVLDLLAMDMQTPRKAATELRRLHAENETLRTGYDAARLEIESLQAQLDAVGAGGVEPLRKRHLDESDSETLDKIMTLADMYASAAITDGCPVDRLPRNVLRRAIAEALAAAPAQPVAVPEGWQQVPVEPTKGMKAAAVKFANGPAVYKAVAAAALEIEEGIYGEAYEAMLAAAPSGTAREPLSQERLQFLSGEYEDIPEEGVAFRDGWRSAEMHHGITAAQKGCQDAEV